MAKPSERRSHRSVPPSEPCPWLVYRYGTGMQNQLFCSLSEPHKTYHKRIAELRGDTYIVAQSSSNWFLLREGTTQFSLWNPTNSTSIQLPPLSLKHARQISECVLSSPPGDPDCKVVLFDDHLRFIIFIRPESVNKQWIEIPYGKLIEINVTGHTMNDNDSLDYTLNKCVALNGKLYGLTFNTEKLVEINLDKANRLVVECLPCQKTKKLVTFTCRFLHRLVECCGELFYVFFGYGGIRYEELILVQVFKLDFVRMIWERAESLMGQAIFLCGMNSISRPAIGDGVECDCIYFTLSGHGGLCSYNVKDCYLSLNLPYPSVPTQSSPMILVPDYVGLSFFHTQGKEEHSEATGKKEDIAEEIQIKGTRLSCSDTQGNEEQGEETCEKEDNVGEIQIEETTFFDLPLDALQEIAKCLNLYDYLNFRAVCWDCRLTVPKLQRKEALQILRTSPSSPWLLYPTNDMGAFNLVDPIHGNRFLMTLPESLVGSIVRYSKNGWLLMADGKYSVSFYNPFTEEIIKLPNPPQGCACSSGMAFTSLPTSPDCVVVGCSGTNSVVRPIIATTGEKEWHEEFVEDYSAEFLLCDISPVFFKGYFSLMGEGGNLSVLKYKEERVELELVWSIDWGILDKPKTPCKSFHQIFLLECDGKLMSIFVGYMGKWVQVFRLNISEMIWEKVESLENHVIYVSRSSCISMEARIQGTKNRIYFPRFHGNSILYYSLETKRFQFDNGGSVEGFYNTKEPLLASWIDPDPQYWC